LLPTSNSIFNSAVVSYGGGFAGVFRCDDTSRQMSLYRGSSPDGLAWKIDPEPIRFKCDDPEIGNFVYGYDPRVVWIEDRYYVTWCNYYHGPTIGVAWTKDFKTFNQFENAFLPFNRNGVLFPRKINGSFAMLSRPSDNGHTPFGEIYYSESRDLVYWASIATSWRRWQLMDVHQGGRRTDPDRDVRGWLMIYHGVLTSCNGFVYSAGTALLDLDKPWKVIARSRIICCRLRRSMSASEMFPTSSSVRGALRRSHRTAGDLLRRGGYRHALMFAKVDELVEFTKKNAL